MRPKGSPNKATAAAREAFASLLDGRLADLDAWIGEVSKVDPYRAFTMVMELARYCVPRPGIVQGDPPAPLTFKVVLPSDPDHPGNNVVRFIDPVDPQ